MGNRNRSNVLLVEILIVVLFFMLSATVLVQVFSTARSLTLRAGAENRALAEAQNVAETLMAADDVDAVMTQMEFRLYHDAWSRDYGEYTLYVETEEVAADVGTLWKGTVRAFYHNHNLNQARREDEELFALPCARYREVAA